jgi:magnesium-transporting ATPase (P-type)
VGNLRRRQRRTDDKPAVQPVISGAIRQPESPARMVRLDDLHLVSYLSVSAHLGNKYLPLSIAAVVMLQLLFTYVPLLQAIFGTEPIPLQVWPVLLGGGLVFFVVVEAEKFVIRSSASLRQAVTAMEAGG